MRYGHLERFEVELTVKTPLHIGDGTSVSKNGIILDNGMAYIPSITGMIDHFAHKCRPNTLEAFEYYMQNSNEPLDRFLKDQRIPYGKDTPWIMYADKLNRGVNRINTLKLFVRDAAGRAYIPGTSIKGAIRTAMIAGMDGIRGKTSVIRDEMDACSRRISGLEELLRTLPIYDKRPLDAVNDLMKAVQVSDTSPIDKNGMIICCRMWIAEDGTSRNARSPVYNECVMPGTKVRFYLTLDGSLVDTQKLLKQILDSLKVWNDICDKKYERYFDGIEQVSCTNKLVLGAGTGFQRKSLVYAAADVDTARKMAQAFLLNSFRNTYKPRHTAGPEPYMMKGVEYNGAMYPMGICDIAIK